MFLSLPQHQLCPSSKIIICLQYVQITSQIDPFPDSLPVGSSPAAGCSINWVNRRMRKSILPLVMFRGGHVRSPDYEIKCRIVFVLLAVPDISLLIIISWSALRSIRVGTYNNHKWLRLLAGVGLLAAHRGFHCHQRSTAQKATL